MIHISHTAQEILLAACIPVGLMLLAFVFHRISRPDGLGMFRCYGCDGSFRSEAVKPCPYCGNVETVAKC